MNTLVIALIVVGLILGGPITAYIGIKVLNILFGDIKFKLIRLTNSDAKVGFLLKWDDRSFPYEISRVKIEFNEMVPGGRSGCFSYTFEDNKTQRKSFIVPMKLENNEIAFLEDNGINNESTNSKTALKNSFISIEIEKKNGNVVRKKYPKKTIHKWLTETIDLTKKEVTVHEAASTDRWSVLTRVFPWRKVVAVAPKKAAKGTGGATVTYDFLVSKVWIEPGCIVCDACEEEAPDVFQVLEDTCIVRENAPMIDVAAIVAAAEGCPVDVIKYDTVDK